MDFNAILDQFEDYEEENSILSHETENDIFFYPNNNSILSGSKQNFDLDQNILPKFLSPRCQSPLIKNPFEDAFMEINSKENDILFNNRKALTKKEQFDNSYSRDIEKIENNLSSKETSSRTLNTKVNFYHQENIDIIFPKENSSQKQVLIEFYNSKILKENE